MRGVVRRRSRAPQGAIVLGDAGGFARQEVPLESSLPSVISVGAAEAFRDQVTGDYC